MAEYRYLAHDVTSRAFLGELPLASVSFAETLNSVGELSATLDLATRTCLGGELASQYVAATSPRRASIWVERDGVLVWGGIIWSRRRSRGTLGEIEISALDFGSILERRVLTATKSYTAADQLAVVRDLVTWAQATPGGNINLVVGSETSGVNITREPLAWGYELRNLADLIGELAQSEGGFDWSTSVAYDDLGVPEATFRLHYPRRGRRSIDSSLVFFNAATSGGNLIDWDLDESGLDAAITIHGIGSGEGESMIQTVASRTELLDVGYPLTEAVISHKSITDSAALLGLTVEAARLRSNDVATWSLTVDPDDISVPFGTWSVGDDARIVIDDHPLFPSNGSAPGLETTLRIVGQSVTVSDDGGPDDVTLTMGPARG